MKATHLPVRPENEVVKTATAVAATTPINTTNCQFFILLYLGSADRGHGYFGTIYVPAIRSGIPRCGRTTAKIAPANRIRKQTAVGTSADERKPIEKTDR